MVGTEIYVNGFGVGEVGKPKWTFRMHQRQRSRDLSSLCGSGVSSGDRCNSKFVATARIVFKSELRGAQIWEYAKGGQWLDRHNLLCAAIQHKPLILALRNELMKPALNFSYWEGSDFDNHRAKCLIVFRCGAHHS